MGVVTIILCAVSITVSIFLIARFGIKKKESIEFVAEQTNVENVDLNIK